MGARENELPERSVGLLALLVAAATAIVAACAPANDAKQLTKIETSGAALAPR